MKVVKDFIPLDAPQRASYLDDSIQKSRHDYWLYQNFIFAGKKATFLRILHETNLCLQSSIQFENL